MERLRRVRDLHPLERAHGAQPKNRLNFLSIGFSIKLFNIYSVTSEKLYSGTTNTQVLNTHINPFCSSRLAEV